MDITKISPEYTAVKTKGGSVGYVEIIEGAIENEPIKCVRKTQKKWQRPGDPPSWRREYDLYSSDFAKMFDDKLRWPTCFHSEIDDEKTVIWMEYVDGVNADDMTPDMFERVAYEWGRLHGRMQDKPTPQIENLSGLNGMKEFYYQNRTNIKLPESLAPHLRHLIEEIDKRSEDLWFEIEKLPIVICHRDLFPPNIILQDECIVLIDWDSTGMGYYGEDIVGLVCESADPSLMPLLFSRTVLAYNRGFAETSGVMEINTSFIFERMVMHFGRRLLHDLDWLGRPKSEKWVKHDYKVLEALHEISQSNGGHNN